MRAESAPMVLAVLGRIFIDDNHRTLTESRLVSMVDELLRAVNERAGGEHAAYPRTAKEYVDAWASPDVGLLRKVLSRWSSRGGIRRHERCGTRLSVGG